MDKERSSQSSGYFAWKSRPLSEANGFDCLVTGYECLTATLTLPDADDRHVLAAAIHAGATFIVTFNVTDFPASILGFFSIDAIHPDDFVTRLWEEHPDSVLEAVRLQRAGLKNPPMTPAEYLATLEQSQLPQIAACLLPHIDKI